MNLYIATIGELIIIEAFVAYIWLQVLAKSIGVPIEGHRLEARKVLLTSIGLVLSAIAILGIMLVRVYAGLTGFWPFISSGLFFYVLLASSGILFIISACIGNNWRFFKVFVSVTIIWTSICIYLGFK